MPQPVKACADWHWGKRVYHDCQFRVNMKNHHLRYGAAVPHEHLADITPPLEDQKATNTGDMAAAPMMATARQDEQLTLLEEIVTMIDQINTWDTCRNHVVHQTLAQRRNDLHDADRPQLQRMTHTLETIIAEQQ